MSSSIYDTSSMESSRRRAWCEVDLDAIKSNAEELSHAADAPLIPILKADAYGLGAVTVANTLSELGRKREHLIWGFGVATIDEATSLREAGCRDRLLCCGPVLREFLPELIKYGITPSLHRVDDILEWKRLGGAQWHLAIDTGMNRSGVSWRDAKTLSSVVRENMPEGVYTHFHSAELEDMSSQVQTQRFASAVNELSLPHEVLFHGENSPSLTASDRTRPHGFKWSLARPGIALYGYPRQSPLSLAPALSVYARVLDVREIMTGDTVGYDATWTASRPTKIATMAVGYADGYRRAFSGKGHVRLNGEWAGVVGTVTMDMTMLDVTDIPCQPGDVVTVLGKDVSHVEITLDTIAQQSGLSPYELLVGWRFRLPRVYRMKE